MRDKLDQLRALVLQGYAVVSVESTDDAVVATLRRAGTVVVVHLGRRDAEKLLYSDPLRAYR